MFRQKTSKIFANVRVRRIIKFKMSRYLIKINYGILRIDYVYNLILLYIITRAGIYIQSQKCKILILFTKI